MRLRFTVIALSQWAMLAFATPTCLKDRQVLPIDNQRALELKTTEDQTHDRVHIKGALLQAFPHEHGHTHWEIQLGDTPNESIEFIYNDEFGALPAFEENTQVEACGDYITSIAPFENYPASPDGALVHWLHENTGHSHHADGFVVINNTMYGMRR